MYKTILVTGGAGFVGSNLAIKLQQNNVAKQVVALDNLKRRGSELNLARLRENNVIYIHGDIRNRDDIEAAGAFDLMIECSAEPSVLAGFNESSQYVVNTNLFGSFNCFEAVKKNNADIIFLSTSRVYPTKTINELKYLEAATRFQLEAEQQYPGISTHGISENFPLNGPRSLYGATKLASELLLTEYIDMYGIRGIINRCGVLTGPWQMGKIDQGVIVLWIARHLFEGNLKYIGYGGKGKQVRDILHIDDLYDLIILQLTHLSKCNGKIYNIGGGNEISVSLCELTKLCQQATAKEIAIGADINNRKADIPYYISDCRKIKKDIGWSPKKDPRYIVEDIVTWIKNHQQQLKPILR